MRLLITGASGLLGAEMLYHARQNGIDSLAVCHRPREGFVAADLATEDGIERIAELEWDTLIHCAAWRTPEQCQADPQGAARMNAWAAGELAKLATARQAAMLHISTDYVFPGDNPPYAEDADPAPINVYGESKLAGEMAVGMSSSNHIILRIPILYGLRAGIENSHMITAALKAIRSTDPCWMDTRIVRYPTYTGDVADAAFFLLAKNASGTFHVSGQDKTDKYGICRTIAEIIGGSIDHIEARRSDPGKEAPRPEDAHLSMDKLKQLGFRDSMPFRERVALLLEDPGLSADS